MLNPELDLPTALVLGIGNHGLSLIRSLGRRGIQVDACESGPSQSHHYSCFCRKIYTANSLDDDTLTDFLLELGKQSLQKRVLFITKDKTVSVISRARKLLEPYYYFNLPDETTIRMLMDKRLLSKFLQKIDCRAPKTAALDSIDDIHKSIETVGFPCIIKPPLRSYGFKAVKVNTEKELISTYRFAAKYSKRLILQEWVPGSSGDVFFCFVYIDRNGNCRDTFVGRKIRQHPNDTGIASATESVQNDFILKETIRLLKTAGYRGFGSTEFKRDPASGKYYFIEFSVGRTDSNVESSVANGVDLPFIGYCDLAGIPPMVVNRKSRKNGVRWVDLGRDIRAIREQYQRGECSRSEMVKTVLKDLHPGNAFSFFAPDDIRPFCAYILDLEVRALRKFQKMTGLRGTKNTLKGSGGE